MDKHKKKRLEIILEAPALHRLTHVLDSAGASGYTVFPALGGRGKNGQWSREGLVGGAGQMVMVVCITDPSRAESILAEIMGLLRRQIGIVSMSEVEVVRGERF